jgi:hypothetical protein
MKFVVIACFGAAALATVGCAADRGMPTRPSVSTSVAGLAASASGNDGTAPPSVALPLAASPRSGDLHVTKECSGYNGLPGSFCKIESSNVKAIEVGSIIRYLQPEQLFTPLGSDVVLDPPGPGNNTANGHCSLALGACTFSGGNGKFNLFHADVAVWFDSELGLWRWEGTYSFNPHD